MAERPIAPVLKGYSSLSHLPTRTRENQEKQGVFAKTRCQICFLDAQVPENRSALKTSRTVTICSVVGGHFHGFWAPHSGMTTDTGFFIARRPGCAWRTCFGRGAQQKPLVLRAHASAEWGLPEIFGGNPCNRYSAIGASPSGLAAGAQGGVHLGKVGSLDCRRGSDGLIGPVHLSRLGGGSRPQRQLLDRLRRPE